MYKTGMRCNAHQTGNSQFKEFSRIAPYIHIGWKVWDDNVCIKHFSDQPDSTSQKYYCATYEKQGYPSKGMRHHPFYAIVLSIPQLYCYTCTHISSCDVLRIVSSTPSKPQSQRVLRVFSVSPSFELSTFIDRSVFS